MLVILRDLGEMRADRLHHRETHFAFNLFAFDRAAHFFDLGDHRLEMPRFDGYGNAGAHRQHSSHARSFFDRDLVRGLAYYFGPIDAQFRRPFDRIRESIVLASWPDRSRTRLANNYRT